MVKFGAQAPRLRSLGFSCDLLGLGFDFVDITDQIEGLLWKAVKFAGENLIEAADGVFEFHVLTRHPGEDLSHEEGLGQELLDFASTVNCLAVILREFIQTKNAMMS